MENPAVARSTRTKLVSNVHSHYETLKVARDAPVEVIRAAYKALAQKWHPDKSDSLDAAKMMQIINSAFEQLSDVTKRLNYDQWLEAEEFKWILNHPTIDLQTKSVASTRGTSFLIDEMTFAEGVAQWQQPRPLWQRAMISVGALTVPGIIFAIYLAISKA